MLTVCGVIAGAEGWEEIADFGDTHLEWLKIYGDFENGIPSHNTIARVIGRLNPSQMQSCFSQWMQSCHTLTEGSIIAIDGKTLRSSYDKSRRRGAIHMISAFCVENGMVMGQLKTAEKSNEITAIPEFLKLLEIRGCLVTLDAMGCQRAIARAIIDKDSDYLLAVKGNQPRLEKAFKEDVCRIRREDVAENLAAIRHYPIFGKRIYGAIGHTVDGAAVLGAIFGIATSLGIGIIQLNFGLSYMFGVPESVVTQTILAVFIVIFSAGYRLAYEFVDDELFVYVFAA